MLSEHRAGRRLRSTKYRGRERVEAPSLRIERVVRLSLGKTSLQIHLIEPHDGK